MEGRTPTSTGLNVLKPHGTGRENDMMETMEQRPQRDAKGRLLPGHTVGVRFQFRKGHQGHHSATQFQKGHRHTPETIQKIRAALKGNTSGYRFQKGHASRLRHGMEGTPTYRTWESMIQRTTNPNRNRFRYYGGRGITVCEQWRDFANFFADMGERPPGTSIDRINNDGNYEPGNCRWATPKEQANNTRRSRRISDETPVTSAM